jgi:hypothetical protein
MTTRVIVCLDGCGPDYLAAAAAVLREEKGIEAVLTREVAAWLFSGRTAAPRLQAI